MLVAVDGVAHGAPARPVTLAGHQQSTSSWVRGPDESRSGPGDRPGRRGRCRTAAWRSQEDGAMPHYMVQFSYSPQVWAGLIEQPEDRTAAVRGLIEGVGGRLVGLYWAFGDYDGVAIFEAPDNIAIGGAMV